MTLYLLVFVDMWLKDLLLLLEFAECGIRWFS